MTLVKGTIGLSIRERHPSTVLSKYDKESNKQWVKLLPKGNLGKTSREVYHRLLKSNEELIDAKTRFELLTSLTTPVKFICDALHHHYSGETVALNDRQLKIAHLCQAIQLEVAIGFKTIIEDLLNDEKFTDELLPSSVNLTLFYLHKVQIRSYQLHAELASGLWHEIHLLYQLAEQNQFHETIVECISESLTANSTYQKIFLLATTNPNQLAQSDIEIIATSLNVLIQKTSMGSDPEADYDFVANLKSDAPPFHRSLLKDDIKAYYRGINLSKTVALLERELNSKDNSVHQTKFDNKILQHLLNAWGAMITRSFARELGSGSIRVCVGLAGCHYLINKELNNDSETDTNLEDIPLSGYQEENLIAQIVENNSPLFSVPKTIDTPWDDSKGVPKLKTTNMWHPLPSEGSKETKQLKSTQNESPVPEKIANVYNYEDAIIINVSSGGYCLKLDGLLPKLLQAGEVIGLLEFNSEAIHTWNIGSIRWIQRHDMGNLLIGIQLIAPYAKPIYARLATIQEEDPSYQPCLLLPAKLDINQPASILTSPGPFTVGRLISIKSDKADYNIRLTRFISSGHSYQQFEYEIPTKNKENITSPINFDSVWDSL